MRKKTEDQGIFQKKKQGKTRNKTRQSRTVKNRLYPRRRGEKNQGVSRSVKPKNGNKERDRMKISFNRPIRFLASKRTVNNTKECVRGQKTFRNFCKKHRICQKQKKEQENGRGRSGKVQIKQEKKKHGEKYRRAGGTETNNRALKQLMRPRTRKQVPTNHTLPITQTHHPIFDKAPQNIHSQIYQTTV